MAAKNKLRSCLQNVAAIKYLKYVVFEVRIFKYVADLFIEVIMIDLLP